MIGVFFRQWSFTFMKVKTTVKVPLHDAKAYKGRREIAPLIRNTGTRRR
jgi:hypothetical protein